MKTKNIFFISRAGFWLGSILIVLFTGVHFFPLEDADLNFWGALYYSIRLFILEHDLPHFPVHNPLIFIYFFAPLVSISIVGTAISYLYQLTPSVFSKWKKGHVVVCGVGRTGKLVVSALVDRGIKVVGLDSDSPKKFDKFCEETKVPVITGDFLSSDLLKKAGAHGAGDIVFASSNDLLNIEGVIGAYGWLTGEQTLLSDTTIWAHVANEKLTETVRQSLNVNGKIRIRFFDTFHIAATKMVDKFFNQKKRKHIKSITILGFGKFGRDLMEVLILDQKEGENWDFKVVDILDRGKEVASLSKELGVEHQVTFMQADILDVDLVDERSRAFFLCTDDDIRNLTTALELTNRVKGSCIYVRMAMWPLAAVKDHLSDRRGLVFVNINDLVVEGIQDIEHLSRVSTKIS